MGNFFDYLKWRGDLSFAQDSFNEIDNALLSQIIYTDLDEIIKEDECITLQEASKRYFAIHTEEEALKEKSFVHMSPIVMKKMAKTKRFKDMKMHHYLHILRKEDAVQFAAIQFDIDAHTTYIAYRGTDDTLIGWREDFDMTYKEVPSQREALRYFEQHAKLFHSYYLGGHSKGGNLAAYVGMKVDAKARKKIITIFNNDGPGFSKEMFSEAEYRLMLPIFKKYVPEMDMVGGIFDTGKNHITVQSTAKGPYQHDMTTWQIQGNHFMCKKKTCKESELFF